MTTVLVLGGILVIALIVQILWARRDRTREAHAAVALSAAAQLGDVAPPSLHPQIDPSQCIGSGACVTACPEKQILGIVEGRAHLLNPLACVGHGACASACPVQAISLVFGTAKRGVELPKLDETFQTNKPGVYVVGELGGMGLIRNAIRQGAEAAEYIARSGRRGTPGGDTLDAVVVGAGPGGIAATLGLMEAGLRVTMLEREAFGGTVAHYPRSKIVMTGPLEIPRYGTVRKQTMRKEELLA
ncbi:MAG: 4Fe-4S binding protein, partial [Deltaproteobacteria bacterium]|nr:4Fe-4S binding protein [Deltaproteobacteria bacterium]